MENPTRRGTVGPCVVLRADPPRFKTIPVAKTAVLMLAEIKAATQAFDRGEINVIDALDAIVVAVGPYQAAEQPRRDAA